MKKNLFGFTLTEIIIVIGILGILFSLAFANLFAPKQKASTVSSIDQLVTDLKSQQLKAMIGETEGAANHDNYGVHFEQSSYTLFKGVTFTSGDSHNFTIQLGDNINFFNVLFPSSQVVYTAGSGEISQFTQGSNSVTVRNIATGDQKTITINRYGVMTSIN